MPKHENGYWNIVPLSQGQSLDVRPEDVLNDGLYRKCDTYRGGGGYDMFPYKVAERFDVDPDQYRTQFIAQLYGCNLDCPYCYVTREGVWGKPTRVTTDQLIADFRDAQRDHGANVFHLMGGAPALTLPRWPDLIDALFDGKMIFHSDLMLSERRYDVNNLYALSKGRCLYAINIKGLDAADWEKNTRKPFNEEWFWYNWRQVQYAHLPAYVTFTGADPAKLDAFWTKASKEGISMQRWRPGSYNIDLVDYDATAHVDDVTWGRQ